MPIFMRDYRDYQKGKLSGLIEGRSIFSQYENAPLHLRTNVL